MAFPSLSCVCLHVHREVTGSFHHVGLRNQTQVVRVGGRHLYPLSLAASPGTLNLMEPFPVTNGGTQPRKPAFPQAGQLPVSFCFLWTSGSLPLKSRGSSRLSGSGLFLPPGPLFKPVLLRFRHSKLRAGLG